MPAFYNEIDVQTAAWLKQLIRTGAINHGEVETRSIEVIQPRELERFQQAHFFAGIGVWSYALRSIGWPDDSPVWTGSCPCQPFSGAGRKGGFDDERHLWPDWFKLIKHQRPPVIFGEQVASKDGLTWLDSVCDDLEGAGYTVGAADLCAAGVGAPHIRQRLYFGAVRKGFEHLLPDLRVGNANGARLERHAGDEDHGSRRKSSARSTSPTGSAGDGMADTDGEAGRLLVQSRKSRHEKSETRRSGKVGRLGNTDRGSSAGHSGTGVGPEAETEGLGHFDRGERDGSQPPGPVNGHWRNAVFIPCRDGKLRPIESITAKVVDGLADLVGYVRAERLINAQTLQKLLDASDPETLQRALGGQRSVPASRVLRPELYGGGDGRGHQSSQRSKRKTASAEVEQGLLRSVRAQRSQQEVCPPQGREPSEQFAGKPDHIVWLVPSALAFAQLHGDGDSALALSLLQTAVLQAGNLLHSPDAFEKAWASAENKDQARIRMAVDQVTWSIVASAPLMVKAPGRIIRLKGYGNAIVPQVAATFVEAFIEAVRGQR